MYTKSRTGNYSIAAKKRPSSEDILLPYLYLTLLFRPRAEMALTTHLPTEI